MHRPSRQCHVTFSQPGDVAGGVLTSFCPRPSTPETMPAPACRFALLTIHAPTALSSDTTEDQRVRGWYWGVADALQKGYVLRGGAEE